MIDNTVITLMEQRDMLRRALTDCEKVLRRQAVRGHISELHAAEVRAVLSLTDTRGLPDAKAALLRDLTDHLERNNQHTALHQVRLFIEGKV